MSDEVHTSRSGALSPDLRTLAHDLARRGRQARVLAETGSTNDDARAWAAEGAPSGAVVVADAQTRGRGRHGRTWSSPSGESLALSVVLRPTLTPMELPKLALVSGLAVRRAIALRLPRPEDARVKWPNDVVIGGADLSLRKLAGVLVEGSIAGQRVDHVVVGVGINVARRAFPPELHATSLALEDADDLDRGALAVALLEALDDELSRFLANPAELAARLAPHDALFGRSVRIQGETRGIADGIAPDGRLRVRTELGVVLAHAGEVIVE